MEVGEVAPDERRQRVIFAALRLVDRDRLAVGGLGLVVVARRLVDIPQVAEEQRPVLWVGASAAGERASVVGPEERLRVALAPITDDEEQLRGRDRRYL